MALIIENNNCETINLTTDLLLELTIPNTVFKITAQYNCCISSTVVLDSASTNVTILGNVATLLPDIFPFNEDIFKDGIYSFTVEIEYPDSTYKREKNCFFVDCSTFCTLSEGDLDKILIHYGLTSSNNCGCDCAAMCELFNKLLGGTDDCGC